MNFRRSMGISLPGVILQPIFFVPEFITVRISVWFTLTLHVKYFFKVFCQGDSPALADLTLVLYTTN